MRLILSVLFLVSFWLTAANAAENSNKDQVLESIEADVSSRQLAITSSFVGTEIVIFGTVENSVQPSAEAGTYDVVVVVEGVSAPLILRRRANLGGLWVNTKQTRFASLPSFYAIQSTRPISEIAENKILDEHGIGFEHVRIVEAPSGRVEGTSREEMEQARAAILRLKQAEGLFFQSDYSVAFVGRSLFRTTVPVPANVPVGPLKLRVYLFREGKLLDDFIGEVELERRGVERFLHVAAFDYSILYGIVTILLAVAAGALSAYIFRRGR